MSTSCNKLILILGPTAVGKSSYALELAKQRETVILSADSRQIYQGMSIGTAAPSPEELAEVKHYFIQILPITESYDASTYAHDARELLTQLFQTHDTILMVGGSMMYIQAFLVGMDQIPTVDPRIREELWCEWESKGVEPLREELRSVDPEYLKKIDPNNHKRIIRALEVYRGTGAPYSSFHSGTQRVKHPYEIEIHSLERPRDELYNRIDTRVEQMFVEGLVDEVQQLQPYRHLNALNTIGYKEVFQYLDGDLTLEECQRLIGKNTRRYARQQESYFRRWTEHENGWQVIRPFATRG
ncbi:MAG: tRNA (adenosine(37)-N6)-dimethylallyltransferase MiaA [Porphyromonas sp.]|nr:tRNA (adenosine(37)-N6)-dimethylallyltransferase MiaA [Porphyromonas sp.]